MHLLPPNGREKPAKAKPGLQELDRYEPNSRVAEDEMTLVIAGVDWSPFHKSLRLQPNVWFVSYANPEKKNDIVFNFTFFLSF
ncbi:MAG: hypothetical protein A2W03_05690 [Candidatus Aminicenantes bacterium RBG_16_63_16]|nr:MAG: hypothetical protein A2W03_05690 [Candidatus Aminicenantes bacterium RBG_16_63_16]